MEPMNTSKLLLDRKSPVPLYLQISNQLKEMILRGDVFKGKRLPSTRKLAKSLGLDRSTVLLAYNELYSEGLIEAHVGQGTVVVNATEKEMGGSDVPLSMRWDDFFASCYYSAYESFILKNNDWFQKKEIISLAGGDPAPDMIPADDIREIITKICRSNLNAILETSTCNGLLPLRELLANEMVREGTATYPEEIIITSGSLQALSLLSRTLLDPGDVVVVEKPTFYGALQIFKAAQAKIIGVPIDVHGMQIDALERILAIHKPKFIYTIPTYQNPSGAVLSVERRKALLKLSYRYQVGIIEEDPCSKIFFEKEPPISLKSMDNSSTVIYISTFSKTLFPGFRIGWIICTRQMAKRLAMVRQYEDMHANTFGQHFFFEFIKSRCYDKHLSRIREIIGRRRNAMISALSRYCAPSISWDKPDGGFYLWCKLMPGLRSNEVTEALIQKKVTAIPGTAFFLRPREGADWMRLAFSYETEQRMEKGIQILGEITKTMLARKIVKPDIKELELKSIS